MTVSHAALLQLIGEVNAITLESEPTQGHPGLEDVVVWLELGEHRIELIRALRTGEGLIGHAVTRHGIGCLFDAAYRDQVP